MLTFLQSSGIFKSKITKNYDDHPNLKLMKHHYLTLRVT